ncbi:hypothetical protein CAI21_01250 [Alkalilimnicola ehrlichii]|uniref:Uncharacterized protein n=1 Tax=Alkalilimnicola ehrlichii TaxID=351052 RepID=A0A3E0X1S6_9GAMM|nr:Trm112 family protein [Alkalilimnicola ehrlichii]RFA31290.1 hypothetical protein CAI21_01250 [Alkalilimnicola ehrlichii]RFA39437.1 hypothetical protein CAL65_01165 [Alkalilimnicola ehrlichii]
MAIDHKLLDILCCPATGASVQLLRKEQLKRLNDAIAQGGTLYFDDTPVEAPLKEALITENGERIYRVDDGIPIMLEDKAIPGQVLDNAK